ncbi:MAG: hypothetical protein U1B94_04190 [candidate division NC10 bacterium]|nr:hypothetical protein [candidate division NC10 bacterium]
MDFVDIFSKAEVVQHLRVLAAAGQVKECIHLKVRKGYADAFYPECDVDWAKHVGADNVITDSMADDAPSSYTWPECPRDCPKYSESPNFVLSSTEPSARAMQVRAEPYVHPDRIAQLKACKPGRFDLTKLVALCDELNVANDSNLVLAVGMLVRAILDHVPPLFGCRSFAEVASSYAGGKSFKEAMTHLEGASRKVADSFLHGQIRQTEVLPTKTQVDFRASLDMLLQEVVRLGK